MFLLVVALIPNIISAIVYIVWFAITRRDDNAYVAFVFMLEASYSG